MWYGHDTWRAVQEKNKDAVSQSKTVSPKQITWAAAKDSRHSRYPAHGAALRLSVLACELISVKEFKAQQVVASRGSTEAERVGL